MPGGRPTKFPEGSTKYVVVCGTDLDREVDEVLPLIQVEDGTGSRAPIAKAEFVRDALRLAVDQLKAGRFKPRKSREPERRIIEILKPPKEGDGSGPGLVQEVLG